MSQYAMKAMLLIAAGVFTLVGCTGAGSSAFVVCAKTQPLLSCKQVTAGMKCMPGPGTPGSAPIKCK